MYNLNDDGTTQGLLSDFVDCRERTRLRLQGWRRLLLKDAMLFGDIGHEALGADLIDDKWQDALEAYLHLHAGRARDQQTLETYISQLEVLMPAYLRFHAKRDRKKKTIAVEQIFEVDFHGFKLRGKMDWIYKLGRAFWFSDHKFKAQIQEDVLQNAMRVDYQIRLYWLAIEIIYGEKVAGFVYDIVRRPQHETVEALEADVVKRPQHFFKRYEIRFQRKLFKEIKAEILADLQDFEKWLPGRGSLPRRRNPKACVGRGWHCQYLQVCARGDFSGFEKSDVLFPELEEDEQ